jgi:hypothetical protein
MKSEKYIKVRDLTRGCCRCNYVLSAEPAAPFQVRHLQEVLDVVEMQAGGRLVQDTEGAAGGAL